MLVVLFCCLENICNGLVILYSFTLSYFHVRGEQEKEIIQSWRIDVSPPCRDVTRGAGDYAPIAARKGKMVMITGHISWCVPFIPPPEFMRGASPLVWQLWGSGFVDCSIITFSLTSTLELGMGEFWGYNLLIFPRPSRAKLSPWTCLVQVDDPLRTYLLLRRVPSL